MKRERSYVTITEHRRFATFEEDKGVIFLAAGVPNYLTQDAVKELVSGMAERFSASSAGKRPHAMETWRGTGEIVCLGKSSLKS